MGATAQKIPLKRIRDLRALSYSDNPHEAARARERYEELLARHHLTEADLVEESTERLHLGPAKPGSQRGELARIVAFSRGVRDGKGDNTIEFRGLPEGVTDARALFSMLCRLVEDHCDLPGHPPDEDLLWRICFWLGFIESIQKQLGSAREPIPHSAIEAIANHANIPEGVDLAARAFENMRRRLASEMGAGQAYLAAQGLKESAHNAGLTLGMMIEIPPYRGKR